MTNATTHPEFNPRRSPLFGIAAAVASAATIGLAVLLPMHATPTAAPIAAIAAAQPADVQPAQLVVLPAIEVVGTRSTKSADNRSTVPAVFKQKS